MSRQPASMDELRAVCVRMTQNPADAVALAPLLQTMLAALPPPAARLMSRPSFDRSTLWTETALFEDVAVVGEAPPYVIRLQHDVWIRGVNCQVIAPSNAAVPDSFEDLSDNFVLIGRIAQAYGENLRGLCELNWRVDARQGFISTGTSETLDVASLLTGDGQFYAPLDWRLQKDQTIEIRCRSRLGDIFPPPVIDLLRAVFVTFWGEELNQPSVQG